MSAFLRSVLFIPLMSSLTGFLFSLWNLADADSVPCITAGCALQNAFSAEGVSLWWLGAAVFGLLMMSALFGFRRTGLCLAGSALAGDVFFLMLMLVTAPCFACLIVALLLALNFIMFAKSGHGTTSCSMNLKCRLLLLIWGILFTADAGLVLREMVRPWPVSAPSVPAAVSIYFSTDCPACHRLVQTISLRDSLNIAWYPVAEHGSSATSVLAMEQALRAGYSISEALQMAEKNTGAYWFSYDWWRMQFRLWINRSHVLLSGRDVLPFMEFHGMPSMLLHQQRSVAQPPEDESRTGVNLPFLNLDDTISCTGGKKENNRRCDDM